MLLATLSFVPIARAPSSGTAGTLVGRAAPVLDAVDLDGHRFTLASVLDGADVSGRAGAGPQIVWVNFWATWCPPCATEMPMMQRLSERYQDRLLVLGVDFGEERSAVADFVDRYGIGYPILLDPTLDNFYRWSPRFGLPRHYFVDADGMVVAEFAGELPPELMADTVDELLHE